MNIKIFFSIAVGLGSPVALDYYDRAPFRFSGKINKIDIRYLHEEGTATQKETDD